MKCMVCEYSRTSVNLARGDCDTFCKILNIRVDPVNQPKNCPKELNKNGKE